MADEVGGGNIAEAMRLFEQYKRERGMLPPEAPQDTAGQGFGALFQRGFEAVAKPLGDVVGGLVHTAGIPARAVAAVGTNMFEGSRPVDVSDYALYGQDMETGAPAAHYGDVLAGHLAETGEIAAGGAAEKFIRMAGNMVTDPAMAAPMMSAAEGAASLAGRVGPAGPSMGSRPGGGQPPRSTLHPQYGPMPGGQQPPGGGPGGQAAGGGRPPYQPQPGESPVHARVRATARPGMQYDPDATQPVRGVERVGGEFRDPGATQPVRTVKPTGSSMEAKFVAKRAEGRPSGGLEEKFSKTRAPKEAKYKKSKSRAGKGAAPGRTMPIKERPPAIDQHPTRYPRKAIEKKAREEARRKELGLKRPKRKK